MAVKVGKPKEEPKLAISYMAVADLKDYENNPRLNDSAVPKMIATLKQHGFTIPILVRGNQIVDGHLRIKAARQMKLDVVPAIDVGDMSPEQEKALRIAVNRSAEWASWDDDKLAKEMQAIIEGGLNIDLTGFGAGEADRLIKKMTGEAMTTKTKDANAGTEADPNYVSLTFHMSAKNRDKVMAKLAKVQAEEGLLNPSMALLHLTTQ